MLIFETRFGGNGGAMPACLLPAPAPLPSLGEALSRRAALLGAVASTGFLAAPVSAGAAGIDQQLAALAAVGLAGVKAKAKAYLDSCSYDVWDSSTLSTSLAEDAERVCGELV